MVVKGPRLRLSDSSHSSISRYCHADDTSGHAFLQQAYARLSIALHAANAAIAIGGLQRLRVSQMSGDLPMSPGLGGYPSRRRVARRIAHVRTSRVDLRAAFHGGYAGAAPAGIAAAA